MTRHYFCVVVFVDIHKTRVTKNMVMKGLVKWKSVNAERLDASSLNIEKNTKEILQTWNI